MAALGRSMVRPTAPQALRESHYRILTLAALGHSNVEIARRLGYSAQRVSQIISAPASASEIERLRRKVEDHVITEDLAGEEASIDYRTRILAKQQRLEYIQAAEATGEYLPMKDLNSIIADLEDRFGSPRKSTNLNIAANFGTQLEKAIARANTITPANTPERLP